ncbi:MAG: hypothetical protein F6K40_29655 [Okeania sp. SIO3I5]|uniref:ribbon-helix-helix domain-containing protein n=1 Tax=Okeania sp. SIO3I5 TaxID=2607805 RepID=UPI0013B851BA|nr:type II toxin-antitoxin system ParD family antitoxin [Okeania sp. SIO3I5]NEQ40184.1 hypothetical protein [Okeania sp. SIO3I5]
MNISLNSEQIDLIQQKVKSGRYQDANEVIVEAFRLLEERDRNYQIWIEETQEKVDIAIEEIRRGEGINGEIVINQLKDKLRQSPPNPKQKQPRPIGLCEGEFVVPDDFNYPLPEEIIDLFTNH